MKIENLEEIEYYFDITAATATAVILMGLISRMV
jgi:hypothetical protein